MRLVFWNCGVAPPKGKRSEKRAEAVAGVVNEIVRRRPAIIALCEADAAVVGDLISALELKKHDYRARILNDSIGKSCWDLVLLFDRRQVEVRKKSPITVLNGGVHLRAAYPLKVETLNVHLAFELFLAHWPSRLSGMSVDNRKLCASALRNAIAKRLRESDRVVVLGDFNEEPHDMAICNDLRASRDPEIPRPSSVSQAIVSITLAGGWHRQPSATAGGILERCDTRIHNWALDGILWIKHSRAINGSIEKTVGLQN